MPEQKSRLVIEIDSVYAKQNAQALARELESIEKKGEFATKSMDSMSVSVRNLAGYMAGLVTVGSAISKMDAYTGIQNQLKLVTTQQTELNNAMKETFAIAQRSRSSWESVTTVYQKLAMNAKEIGIAQSDISRLTETVSKGIALSGSSAEGAASAITQLGQALGNGQLRGDEFNAVMENGYGLMRLLAEGMGVPIGQLKAMAEAGELTAEKVTKALLSMSSIADAEFAKTDATIKQSISQLGNAVTKFTGEAGQASGAAQILTSSISMLGQNLEAIANIGMLGGVAVLTKAIVTQTVAVKASINATIEKRLAMTADLQMQTQLAAIEVQRTRLAAAQALTEMNLARAEFNSATTRQARAAATMRLTQAEIAHNIAVKNSTVAIAAQTVAENALNASRAVGARMLALVGGPIGAITLGVTALAAGYMYFSSRAAEANEKLEEQAQVASKTKEELLALEGAQRQSAKSDLASAFESQNKALNDLNQQFNSAVISLQNYAAKNQVSYESLEKIRDISNKVRQGIISQDEAIKQINKLYFVTPDQINQITDLNQKYEEQRIKTQKTADVQAVYGIKVTLSGNAASNAVPQIDQNTQALDDNAAAASNAAKAHQDYLKNIQSQAFDDIYTTGLMNQGRTPAQAKAILELQKAKGESAILTQEEISQALRSVALTEERSRAEQRYASSISKRSKAQSDASKKAKRESENLLDQQKQDREQISNLYATDFENINFAESDELKRIGGAGFSAADQSKYEGLAKQRFEAERAEYFKSLNLELNQYKWSEEKKLEYAYQQDKEIAENGTRISGVVKEAKLKFLDEQYQEESKLIQLSKEQRLFQMREALISETAAMEERYRLEREQILRNAKLSQEQKQLEITLSNAKQQEEVRNRLNQAVQNWGGIQADMNGTTEQWRLEQDRFSRTDASQELFDSKMSSIDQMEKDPNADLGEIARMREQIWFEHHERLKAIESDYQISSMQLQLSYGEQMASSMSTMMGAIFGEKSRAYAAAFAVEKAFAVAQAALAMGQNIAEASKMGFPYNIPMIAGAMAQGAQIASIISSVAQPTGYSDGGFTGYGAKYDPAGIVHKGEVVWSQDDIKRWGGVAAVESMRTSQPPKGYANGGIVSPQDTNRMARGQLDAIQSGANLQAERQAQANAKVQAAQPSVNLNPNFVIVDERESLSDYLYSPDGTKAFVKFFKRNRTALGV